VLEAGCDEGGDRWDDRKHLVGSGAGAVAEPDREADERKEARNKALNAKVSANTKCTFADGSTIYPSEVLEPTPRYDTGVFFATGQDPRRKDALEVLFRLFD
jgi:hypothetical protein